MSVLGREPDDYVVRISCPKCNQNATILINKQLVTQQSTIEGWAARYSELECNCGKSHPKRDVKIERPT